LIAKLSRFNTNDYILMLALYKHSNRVVFDGGTGERVLLTGLWDPPHWSWFKRPWVGHIWSPSLE